MNKRPEQVKKKKNSSKGLTRRVFKRILAIGGISLGVILLVGAVFYFTRPKLLWYVDPAYTAAWTRILNDRAPPFSRYELVANNGESFPKGRFGFMVSRDGPDGQRADEAPVVMYPDLSRAREYRGWIALALDPWMIFRKHQDPEPGRSFLENSNERGSLLLAGLDKNAVKAWLCQLMQERPGVFTQGTEAWEDKSQTLIRDYPFQSGASAYAWVQVWPLLYRGDIAYLYAPLSQARSQPSYRMGLLDATRFPEPSGWERYGMQADILWAGQQGNEKQIKKLNATVKWLKDPKTQTYIANILEWIPAHPSGTPYNTISWETHMAWLRSSYIWQGVSDAQDF